jgi:hypothetical protein
MSRRITHIYAMRSTFLLLLLLLRLLHLGSAVALGVVLVHCVSLE